MDEAYLVKREAGKMLRFGGEKGAEKKFEKILFFT
jgi:hypothetical protein